MAIYGTLGEIDLGALDASISDTAVDIFVYDTRKDSDGGAWRKRTHHTSWYNETLNTATRGSRREFPAVAVIVAESNQVTIYDGDDPDLPMWMVFPPLGYLTWASDSTPSLSSVHMLNGILVAGGTAGRSGTYSDFIKDDTRYIYTSAYYNPGDRTIAGRTVTVSAVSGGSYIAGGDGFVVLNNSINDVAMTVLPNAPVDDATGLPIPTIAVGTDGGVSVIKDDGVVFDIVGHSSYTICKELSFTDDDKIAYTTDNGSGRRTFRVDSIPSSDFTVTTNQLQKGSGEEFYVSADYGLSNGDLAFSGKSSEQINDLAKRNVAHTTGLSLIEKEEGGPRHAFVTSSFNTGWMHGDIKGAFLSDTDTTNLVDTNLVSNGTFDTDTSGWSSIGSITVTQDAGRLKMVSGSGNPYVYTTVTCVVGKRYYFQADFEGSVSFHASPNASSSGDVAFIPYSNPSSSTTKHCFFVATATTMYLLPHVIGTGNTGYVDNVICKLADHDRSVYGSAKATVGGVNGISSGLATYGTITKSAVATGAELVAYSGFSASNYLLQPYNSDLDFGTGNFCYMCWVKDDNVQLGAAIFQRGTSLNGNETVFYIDSSLRLIGRLLSNSGITSNVCFIPGVWNHCVLLRKNGILQVYHNGVLQGSVANTESMDQVGKGLSIGAWLTNNSYFVTAISLFRVSASVPSPEQIKKIYEDEKVLFQENAACTLHGSSDAVTALAYDDSTNLLYAGTSSGRSDFQGLRRINNTTTAVTTAISASNGLVAEQ